ncbi:MAG: SusD/RagB family nutrient-binding outer membrane lipoprotein [Bacteroidales bacterium]|nr:SusD/RagB family nutrient-binding outer membrane lipoprotein [Bacteroidales bacterium]
MKTKYLRYLCFALAALTIVSCQKLVEGINDNPNQMTLDAVSPGLFMNGAELSNITVQLYDLNRMAGFYSGQLIGVDQVEKSKYEYSITTGTFDWSGYQSVIAPIREMQKRTVDNPLYQGITRVLEANLIGTYASLFGDLPYSEAVTDVENPRFDDQLEVFENLQSVLSDAIDFLGNATGYVVSQDYIFSGNRIKWLQTAWTLKARFYMYTKDYDLAFIAAQNGISIRANSMLFKPLDVAGDNSTKNKYYIALANNLIVGTGNSYLIRLLDATSGISRNNAKTNEAARLAYYIIHHESAASNTGIAAPLEPEPIVTFQENLLTLAEAGARTQGFNTGLQYLNQLRAELNTGLYFNSSAAGFTRQYDPYEVADFDIGGIENPDGIEPLRALLREIIEERYISGFTSFMPYDDSRRLKRTDSDIAVPFPLNTPTATQNVERFLYPADEIESNANAPEDPGMYAVTRVNAL